MTGVDAMGPSTPERRRSPRAIVDPNFWLAVPSTWRVQLIDVSLGGLAFTSPYGMEIGRTASVRTTLGREAFHGDVRVCWSRPRAGLGSLRTHFEVGAVFLPLEGNSRRVLESFLKLSRPE